MDAGRVFFCKACQSLGWVWAQYVVKEIRVEKLLNTILFVFGEDQF